MAARSAEEREPRPVAGAVGFEEGDFHGLSEACCGDPQYNDRRLVARRKLLALGKQLAARTKDAGVPLEARSSLHNPNQFNGNRVRRLWSYLVRPKKEKTRLRRTLGADLAKDLDAAYRNAYLCVAIEADALEVSMRIHADAWYDGQNMVRRIGAEGIAGWKALLDELGGFRLRLADWKGEWLCGEADSSALEEFLSYYTPGEHALQVERRWPLPPAARAAAFEPGVPEEMLREALRLLPLYRYAAWSEESDFLFQT
jgi:hypothetical protein